MLQFLAIFKCMECGNIVELLSVGGGSLVCCGAPMQLMQEGTSDGAKEKHVPNIEKTADGFKVKVGSVPHPMEDKHWIQWIELVADNVSYTRFLKPGDAAEAEFYIRASKVTAREYCNLHGHWKTDS